MWSAASRCTDAINLSASVLHLDGPAQEPIERKHARDALDEASNSRLADRHKSQLVVAVVPATFVVSSILAPSIRAFAPPVPSEAPEAPTHSDNSQQPHNRQSFHWKPCLSIRASSPRWRWFGQWQTQHHGCTRDASGRWAKRLEDRDGASPDQLNGGIANAEVTR